MEIDFNQEILKSEEAFDVCFSRNKIIVEALGYKYPQPDIDNIDSYIAHRCINIHTMFLTFYKSYCSKIDILSAYSFLRIFADHVSALKLIYEEENIQESKLRHYLSIADAITSEIEALRQLSESSSITKDGTNIVLSTIKEKEAEYISIVEKIKSLPIYNDNQLAINILIDGKKNKSGFVYNRNNWKYKSLLNTNGNNTYSWAYMYKDRLGLRPGHIVQLSQYVHGLAGSVVIQNNESSEAIIKHIAKTLIMSFSGFLWGKFKSYPSDMEMDYLNSLI